MLMLTILLLPLLFIFQTVQAETHEFHFSATWITANLDGVKERQVISFDGMSPLPSIEISKGDTVLIYLTNDLKFVNTSLHFHGILQNGSVTSDGPELVCQCPISPGDTFLYNFTVHQLGTYWYHSHSGMQYGDGMRGTFIVHDKEIESRYAFDEQLVWTVSDWFHEPSWELAKKFKSRFNPTGSEPVPQNMLFQDSKNVSVAVETNTTYLVHIVNTGMFVSQYIYLEDHEFTVIELDGVFIKPNKTDVLYIAVGQRMSALITTKLNLDKNYALVQVMDDEMLDYIPNDLSLISTNWLTYDESLPKSEVVDVDKKHLVSNAFEEFWARAIDEIESLETADITIELNLDLKVLGDGVSYLMFNDKTYVAPKIPSLYTALTSGEELNNIEIYGSNTNSYIVHDGEIVDIVINNYDLGKHPFHLHGHNFQILHKSLEYGNPTKFNYSSVEIPDYPSIRDTVMVESNGNLLIRFKADNPGVWFFHCHVDYHVAMQGLAITLIESPLTLQSSVHINDNQKQVCKNSDIPYQGNAAGRMDLLNLNGENKQPHELPDGFTTKGYIAFIISTLVGLYGLWTIKEFGISELDSEDEDEVISHLKRVLQQHGVIVDQDTGFNSIHNQDE